MNQELIEKLKLEEEISNLKNNRESLHKAVVELEPKKERLEKEVTNLTIQRDNLINETNIYISEQLDIFNNKREEILSSCSKAKKDSDLEIENNRLKMVNESDRINAEQTKLIKLEEVNRQQLNEIKMEKQQVEKIQEDIKKTETNNQKILNDKLIILEEINNKEKQLKEWFEQLWLLQNTLEASQIMLASGNLSLTEKQANLESKKEEFSIIRDWFDKYKEEFEKWVVLKEYELKKREDAIEEKEKTFNIINKNLKDKEIELRWFEEELTIYNAKVKRADKTLQVKQAKIW